MSTKTLYFNSSVQVNEALKSLLFVSIVINPMDQTMNARKTLNVILSQVNLTPRVISDCKKSAKLPTSRMILFLNIFINFQIQILVFIALNVQYLKTSSV